MQVEYQHVGQGGRDPIDRIRLGLDGVDQIHVGKAPDQFGEPRCKQRRILNQQNA
jgi:hypothetical protein